jgi:hypothetical protein
VQDVVLALLFAGADTSLKDARGFDVMIEGARGSREDIIDVLRRSGARTGISIMLQVCFESGSLHVDTFGHNKMALPTLKRGWRLVLNLAAMRVLSQGLGNWGLFEGAQAAGRTSLLY